MAGEVFSMAGQYTSGGLVLPLSPLTLSPSTVPPAPDHATQSDPMTSAPAAAPIPVTLKWAKQLFTDQLQIVPGGSSTAFKDSIQALTNVPRNRQKLLCKAPGAWKNVLADGIAFDAAIGQNPLLTVILIGSSDVLPDPPPVPPKFIEDITPEELAEAEAKAEAQALAAAEGMIVALQTPPLVRCADGDRPLDLVYCYNALVTGVPQRQIEALLRERRQAGGVDQLQGQVAMSMGLELRPAYINCLAVLEDGTLLSGLDDGHIQFWRHGQKVHDAVHEGVYGGEPGGVESLGILPHPSPASGGPAFASGGRGCVRLWTAKGDLLRMLPSIPGTTPAHLVALGGWGDGGACGVAAAFRITRQRDPNQFRLVPQDEEGRRRRAQAEAQEAAVQMALDRVAKGVQVWTGELGSVELQTLMLEPEIEAQAAPVTAMVGLPDMARRSISCLVAGDAAGGLRVWHCSAGGSGSHEEMPWRCTGLLQLQPQPAATATVVCMEPLPNGLLAVSTDVGSRGAAGWPLVGANALSVPFACAVYVVDLAQSTVTVALKAHRDTVRCMSALPNGGLATGGGKHDATVRVWGPFRRQAEGEAVEGDNGQLQTVLEATTLEKLGYCLALKALPDTKPGSGLFALAGARYNVVRICL